MDLFPAGTHYTPYFFVNLAASLLGLFILVFFYSYRRYLFVKPSVMILGCYHVLAQWPLVLLSPFVETFLPAPWVFSGLVHGFVLIGLLISFVSFDRSARSIWDRLPAAAALTDVPPRWQLLVLFCVILVLATIYLSYIPFEQTGLYVLFTDPEHAVSARESSLKLLDNWIPKYALTLLGNVIAPLFTVATINFVLLNRKCTVWEKGLWFALLTICWLLSALSGAKAIWSYLIIASLASIAWHLRLRIPMAWMICGLAVTLAPAFIVFMLFSVVASTPQCSISSATKSVAVPSTISTSQNTARKTDSDLSRTQAGLGESDRSAMSPDPATSDPRKQLCALRLDLTPSSGFAWQNPATNIGAALGLVLGKELKLVTRAKQNVTNDARTAPGTIVNEKESSSPAQACDSSATKRDNKSLLTLRDTYAQAVETNRRAFVLPTVVSVWFADFAQRNGPIGIAGIPRLAEIAGVTPIDLPNRIGLIYAPCYYGHKVMESVSATTGFLFAEYGYFGLLALPLALIGLIVCDGLLLIIRTFPSVWIAPTLGFVSLAALKFTQSDYLTIWVTHGLGINIILVAGLASAGAVVQRKWHSEAS